MKKRNNMIKQILTAIILVAFVSVSAREKQGSEAVGEQRMSTGAKVMSACKGAKSSHELWVNNVRTIVYTGGDMWWDLFGNGNAFYGVPGNIDRSIAPNSNFGGSIWIGGLDAGGQLKVAAMTYRQTGYDFWPGPLVMATASTDETVCNDYDQIFHVTRKEVEDFVFNGIQTDEIKNWPGNPLDLTKGHDTRLAPFFDALGDNVYDPTPGSGDYPYYDIYNAAAKDNLGVCTAKLFGDESLWWVFNDKGDIHTETGGQSIGLEIRAQAFAFKTSDDINNMTFYNYEVINRSSFSLNKTYFTAWTDPDLGYYSDDYVGCDIDQGLGFIYNSDGYDESQAGTPGYLDFPAAGGCDFFKGPLADANDGIDNDFDGPLTGKPQNQYTGVDEIGETIGMAKFLYYNNNIGSFPVQTTNPALASHYYGYMTGFWKDGSPFTEGGNAYGGSVPTNYCYPGELYPQRTGWNEFDAGNLAGDRRFLQSAGPFTLLPGAVNNVTFGMPWARSPVKNGNLFVVSLLKVADVKAQALFDNCFKLLDGPEAPEMTIQEGNNELLIYLTNKAQSNNYLNGYKEADITILGVPGQTASCLANPDKYYNFEGYKVYQLLNSSVSQTDLDDETKAKLVFECDIKNGVSRLVNYNFDASVGAEVPKVKVEGNDQGIQTTFKVNEDAFSTGSNKKLINNKTYYFMSVAYAYNNYATYKPDTDPINDPCVNFFGQKRPYLEGRKIKKAAGIPHLFDFEKDGTTVQSNYGYGPKITRIEGQGNGGNIMDYTAETEAQIVSAGFVKNPTYQNGRGPITVRVVDPLNIPNSTFTVKFLKLPSTAYNTTNTPVPNPWIATTTTTNQILNGTKYVNINSALNADSITWVLTNLSDNKMYQPKKSIKVGEEYYFSELGLSVNIHQVADPAGLVTGTVSLPAKPNTGDVIEATLTFADPTKQWLSGLADTDGADDENWIRSGSNTAQVPTDYNDYGSDPDKVFAKILGGTWAPYNLTSSTKGVVRGGPGFWGKTAVSNDGNDPQDNDPRYLSSVDVVFTPDKSKWTRCVVLEMQDDSLLAEGVNRHFNMRKHLSVDKQGVSYGASGCVTAEAALTSTMSMGWFPGYAINIETGERLNMAFGEDSYNYADNGNDMRWNPTYAVNRNTYADAFGGRHYVYVFGHGKGAAYANTMTGSFAAFNTLTTTPIGAGRYDAGQLIYQQMKLSNSNPGVGASASLMHWGTRNVMRDAMWVTIPLLNPNSLTDFSFKDPANMPCEAKVRIRVNKPYRYGYSTEWSTRIPYASNFIAHNGPVSSSGGWVYGTSPNFLPKDTSATPQNNDLPMYQFSTDDIYTLIGQSSTAKNALDYIRVVPNPYYAYSKYETNRIDNRVRITNLPSLCTIKIFTMNGTLVRTFKRDVSGQEDEYTSINGDTKQSKRSPYLDWDLKNQYGIPIASGLYILHIDAPGVGEKILKWFGVMRPLDLQNY
jgi:hypothetical protein